MAGQYLTAVFEMRPTKRKAAVLERARAQAEALFWKFLEDNETEGKEIANEPDAKVRRGRLQEMKKRLERVAARQLHEPIAVGVTRNVVANISSYVGLQQTFLKKGDGAQKPEWPAEARNVRTNYSGALDGLRLVTDLETENLLRDELNRSDRDPPFMPVTVGRSRDTKIIRHGGIGASAVELNIAAANDKKAQTLSRAHGVEAASGEVVKAGSSKSKILVPLSCSKWHEQKFLDGRTIHRSSLIVRKQDRWFLLAQFEMAEARPIETNRYLGVDRGVVNPVALSVVEQDGRVVTAMPPFGADIGAAITEAERKRRAEQKRRGRTSKGHRLSIEQSLHKLANEIVSNAKRAGAQVVIENLDGQKRTINQSRKRGARKGGWRKALKRSQLGNLEIILGYKLALAGLKPPQKVFPGGTSTICPKCGARDAQSRKSQDAFECTTCGFTGHADSIAAANIVRRGAQMKTIKKGEKLDAKNQKMVDALQRFDDSGLGPLSNSADWIVAGRAPANSPNHPSGVRLKRGKSSLVSNQNG